MTPEDIIGCHLDFFPVVGVVDAVDLKKRIVRIDDHWFELSDHQCAVLGMAVSIRATFAYADYGGRDLSRFIPAAEMAIEAEYRHNQQRAMADAA